MMSTGRLLHCERNDPFHGWMQCKHLPIWLHPLWRDRRVLQEIFYWQLFYLVLLASFFLQEVPWDRVQHAEIPHWSCIHPRFPRLSGILHHTSWGCYLCHLESTWPYLQVSKLSIFTITTSFTNYRQFGTFRDIHSSYLQFRLEYECTRPICQFLQPEKFFPCRCYSSGDRLCRRQVVKAGFYQDDINQCKLNICHCVSSLLSISPLSGMSETSPTVPSPTEPSSTEGDSYNDQWAYSNSCLCCSFHRYTTWGCSIYPFPRNPGHWGQPIISIGWVLVAI